MRETRLPETKCLNCGHKLDAASSIKHDNAPKPGDVTLCIECSHIMIFTQDMGLRNLSSEEMDEIAKDDDVLKTAMVLKRMRDARDASET